MKQSFFFVMVLCMITFTACNQQESTDRIPVIFDTDANNELDDQHALIYLLFNQDVFDIKAVTVNATRAGNEVEKHYEEAERILKLATQHGKIPLLKGADDNFATIQEQLGDPGYDGNEAVEFIIEQAQNTPEKLIIIAVGKLTNVALALKKEPSIAEQIHLVWLGSNYPDPYEYNLVNDIPSMNYVLQTGVPMEMVMVRYGKPSGTDAIKVSQEEVNERMPGMGPEIEEPITGRHGGEYSTFGDYAVSLFEHIEYPDSTYRRALYDVGAVAVLKNPAWADSSSMPAPAMIDEKWVDQPENSRKIVIWENFDRDAIVEDFYNSLENPVLKPE